MYRKAPQGTRTCRENASRESAAGHVGAGHTKQRRDLGGTEAGGAGSTVQSAGVTGGPSEATARQGRAGQPRNTGRGEQAKVSRALPNATVGVAVQRLGCGWGGSAQVRWRLRSDGGARRLGLRLGGGAAQVKGVAVQRRLGTVAAQVVEQLG